MLAVERHQQQHKTTTGTRTAEDADEPSETSSWTVISSSSTVRITRAVDVFSAGCVAFNILSLGGHPFGDRFSRESNIIRNNYRLDRLDTLSGGGTEAKDLVRRMISRDPKKSDRLAFLQEVSDRLEIESREPPSALLKQLERGAVKVIGLDWRKKIDGVLLENISKYRKYDGSLIRDLLRAMRNKKHHFQDLPAEGRRVLGDVPDGFLAYFSTRFPSLLLHVHGFVADSRALRGEPAFRSYFETARER
ncbi:bifunctional endoribonuclease/protein kinase ire1 [Cladochytrium tenue]|nr:bifunctional endoribonuclease/protein kinase ire1 [Cladochytrium tenue]